MERNIFKIIFLTFLIINPALSADLSDESKACIYCHKKYTPGIVEDWNRSRHSKITPTEAFDKPEIERRISSIPPDWMRDVAVGCYECHSLNAANHTDSFNHMGFVINVIVSPRDCSVCHRTEYREYMQSVKSHAVENLDNNPIYHQLVEVSTAIYNYSKGLKVISSSTNAQNETCYYCHGTRVTFKGMKESDTGITIPELEGWPNHGVGRINPDGSRGACTACHPRHGFSIEMARNPYTCAQCHLEPDVPAYNVWKESKHGNIFLTEYKDYNMTAVPWVPGKHFKAPSCAVCHSSLLVDDSGRIIAKRTHNFDSRIYIRIFGIYAHPQPKDGATWKIKNSNGLPLPATLTGELAKDYLIDRSEMAKRKEQFLRICDQCHSRDFAERHFEKFERTVNESNSMTLVATKMLIKAWEEGLINNSNLFDEYVERLWVENWLFYATSLRHGSAMGGPDYSTFKLGWYQLTKNLREINNYMKFLENERKMKKLIDKAERSPGFDLEIVVVSIISVIAGLNKMKKEK